MGAGIDAARFDHLARGGAASEAGLDVVASLPICRIGIAETGDVVQDRIDESLLRGGVFGRFGEALEITTQTSD